LKLARYGNDYLDSQFKNGADGSLFELELIYFSDSTVDGNKESLKRSPNMVKEIDIRDLGDSKEAYRWNYILKNNTDKDDFRRIIDLAKAFSLTGDDLDRASQQVMDVDQWARTMAMISLTGVGDTYGMDLNHNLQLYVRPEDSKVLLFPWDYDFAFFHSFNSPLLGTLRNNRTPILEIPHNQRLVHGHMLDLIRTSYNTEYLAPWIDNYTRLTDCPDLAPFLVDPASGTILARLYPLDRTANADGRRAVAQPDGQDVPADESQRCDPQLPPADDDGAELLSHGMAHEVEQFDEKFYLEVFQLARTASKKRARA